MSEEFSLSHTAKSWYKQVEASIMTPFGNDFDKRRETRIPLTSIPFPFVGVRPSRFLRFQYRLIDASANGAQFAIPSWGIGREKLRFGDEIHFFLPLLVGEKFFETGKVVWVRDNPETDELACGATLQWSSPVNPYFQVRLEREGEFVFLKPVQLPDFRWFSVDALMDAARRKKHQAECLKRLIPHYPTLSLESVRAAVVDQASQLEHTAENINRVLDPIQGIDQFINFGILRPILITEHFQTLFEYSFREPWPLSVVEEIQQEEKGIYAHYNFLVLTAILVLV